MNDDQRRLIEKIHTSGNRFVIAVSGGGSGAISDLLSLPGGSRSLLEAVVPYSAAAMTDWLGGAPDQSCSERTARAMAMAAFMRARELAPDDDVNTLVGIGCTASLASDRPKRGPHRIHVAWQTARVTGVDSLQLIKGVRDRASEEQVATALVLYAMSQAIGDDADNEFHEQLAREFEGDECDYLDIALGCAEWAELLLGECDSLLDGGVENADRELSAECPIFPGAFNPLHDGHRRMAEIAEGRKGESVWFELSLTNVDKPPLDYIEIVHRLNGLGDVPIILTRAAQFTEKAKLFPGATFIVGADTIERIADPRYYSGVPARVAAASFAALGCRFLVFGRLADGEFVGLEDLNLPPELRDLCVGVPESEFRDDISSTELRKTGQNGR